MGQVINLRTRRKQALRQQAADEAAAHRLKHGRSKAERMLAETRSAKADRELDGHRLDSRDQS